MCVSPHLPACLRGCVLCFCVCACDCVRDPEWLGSNKEMKSFLGFFFFFSPPSEPFSFITSPALPWATGCAPTLQPTPRQASAASILWTEVLSGYYFSADHIKTTAIKRYWAIRLCLLRGEKKGGVSEWARVERQRRKCRWKQEKSSRLMLLNGEKDLYVSSLRKRRRN